MNRSVAVLLSALALTALGGVLVAGPLTPPAGSVAPSYKTLTDVEPRIALSAANTPGDADSMFKITQPGSYYLTGNMEGVPGKCGIEITGYHVVLDLNGYQMKGATGALEGIRIGPVVSDVTIRNGTLWGWVTAGIASPSSSGPVSIEGVSVSQISGGDGIAVRGPAATISNCRVSFASGFGIDCPEGASISGCAVANCGNDGFSVGTGATLINCTSQSNASEGFSSSGGCTLTSCSATYNDGVGILAGVGSLVSQCAAANNANDGIRGLPSVRIIGCTSDNNLNGIYALDGCAVESCSATGNDADGIRLSGSGVALNNQSRGNGVTGTGCGVFATGTANRIDGNHCVDNDFGVRCNSSDNLVVRNSARNNASGNFSFPSGSEYGQILTNPGNGFAATNPWANFAY